MNISIKFKYINQKVRKEFYTISYNSKTYYFIITLILLLKCHLFISILKRLTFSYLNRCQSLLYNFVGS